MKRFLSVRAFRPNGSYAQGVGWQPNRRTEALVVRGKGRLYDPCGRTNAPQSNA